MVFEEKLGLVPMITFDQSFTLNDLGIVGFRDAEQIMQALVDRAKKLLDKHISYFE